MIICKSYINKPESKINNLEKINEEWDKYFIEIAEKNRIALQTNQ